MADWADMMDDETGQAFLENEEPPAAAGAAEASGRTSPTPPSTESIDQRTATPWMASTLNMAPPAPATYYARPAGSD